VLTLSNVLFVSQPDNELVALRRYDLAVFAVFRRDRRDLASFKVRSMVLSIPDFDNPR
jgi:hypothetical protein